MISLLLSCEAAFDSVGRNIFLKFDNSAALIFWTLEYLLDYLMRYTFIREMRVQNGKEARNARKIFVKG